MDPVDASYYQEALLLIQVISPSHYTSSVSSNHCSQPTDSRVLYEGGPPHPSLLALAGFESCIPTELRNECRSATHAIIPDSNTFYIISGFWLPS